MLIPAILLFQFNDLNEIRKRISFNETALTIYDVRDIGHNPSSSHLTISTKDEQGAIH